MIFRDSDSPVILSCAGTLSPEGGISVWEKELTEAVRTVMYLNK